MTVSKITFSVWLFALAVALGNAGTQVHDPADKMPKTAVSGDQVVKVRYPSSLMVCSHKDGENPDVWAPEECVADIPVCDNSGHAGEVMLCLAYPSKEFQKTNLQAAAFAVSRLGNLQSARDCSQKWARSNTTEIHGERIGGLEFQAAHALQTESSHASDQNVYRIFHKGTCYELDINVTTALDSAFAAEDVPRKLTVDEQRRVKESLMQALSGFRFLK